MSKQTEEQRQKQRQDELDRARRAQWTPLAQRLEESMTRNRLRRSAWREVTQ